MVTKISCQLPGESISHQNMQPGGRKSGIFGLWGKYLNNSRLILLITLAVLLIVPAGESTAPDPQIVYVTMYIVDFNRIDVGAGTVGVDFYLDLHSSDNITLNDIELMNGMITSMTPITDAPTEKEYRIVAVLTIEPDLTRYPFDKHTLPIKLEPKLKHEPDMVLINNQSENGIGPDADIPGWRLTGSWSEVANTTYISSELPFSRLIFNYGVERDAMSTTLKFFLPIILIIIVSLSSLVMKTSSRMSLNASMFLSAVLIHWRIVDNIPVVNYATFLDLFMIITYAILVMVLISGILILRYSELENTGRVEQIYYWSLRIIPSVSLILYLLYIIPLFGT